MTSISFRARALAPASAMLAMFSSTVLGQLPDFTGRPVVDLIDALRDQGTRIAYSVELLPARLLVRDTPETDDVLEGLRGVLAAHGLDVEVGPRDTWLIVRRTDTRSVGAADSPNRVPVTAPPALETVIVTASRYPIERRTATSATDLGRHTIETAPALGQDPIRITHRLPGIASDQLNARMHVRGGDLNEVLLRLDGIRLYSPYHLKDFESVFSSINPRIIESMDVRTGGYEARFGDRMSGVVDMSSTTPTEHRHHELGISFLETSVFSSGLFDQGRGDWVTSLRRGNLDVMARVGDSEIGKPQYVDFFNKIGFSLSSRLKIESGLLALDDKISLNDDDTAAASADYGDRYLWFTLMRSGESGLESTYRFSSTVLDRSRIGTVAEPGRVIGSLTEKSRFDRSAFAASWAIRPLEFVRMDFGAEFSSEDLRHDLDSAQSFVIPVVASDLDGKSSPAGDTRLLLDRTQQALHATVRYQAIRRLVTEFGFRWDDQSLTRESQLSPRFNLRFDITARSRIRAGWGEFAQSDSLNELPIADGVTDVRRAEKSSHTVIGFEHAFGSTGLLRLEVYEKDATRLNPRFENLFERVSLIPELLPDRFRIVPVSAKTSGIEISLEGGADRFAWWTNLAASRTRERLAGGTFRRSWDEGHALKAGGEWNGTRWTVSVSGTYRSGWPISRLTLNGGSLIAADYNGSRLPNFSSINVRASRAVDARHGDIEWFIEMGNVADHANYCCLDYAVTGDSGTGALMTEYDSLLGLVPNLGIRWQF